MAMREEIGDALDTLEGSVLSGLPALLDSLLDSASLARPGIDADAFAQGLRETASRIDALTRLVGAVVPADQAAELRISA